MRKKDPASNSSDHRRANDCDRLWSDRGYADKDVELRALMVRFELCYRLLDTGEEMWLVPQHLSPSKPPESTADLQRHFRDQLDKL